MLERMWGKRYSLSLLVGVKTCTVTTLEIDMVVSQKIGNSSTSRTSDTTLGRIPNECSIILQGLLLNGVHNSIICNSQNLETT